MNAMLELKEIRDGGGIDWVGTDSTYRCDTCNAELDIDSEDMNWITSSFGLCEDCRNELSNSEIDRLMRDCR